MHALHNSGVERFTQLYKHEENSKLTPIFISIFRFILNNCLMSQYTTYSGGLVLFLMD